MSCVTKTVQRNFLVDLSSAFDNGTVFRERSCGTVLETCPMELLMDLSFGTVPRNCLADLCIGWKRICWNCLVGLSRSFV